MTHNDGTRKEADWHDFLGHPVKVGDYIFYSTTGRYPESRYCRITRFTEKSVFVKVLKTSRKGVPRDDVIVQNVFVKIP